jgi:hypothetical protein
LPASSAILAAGGRRHQDEKVRLAMADDVHALVAQLKAAEPGTPGW